MHFQFLLTVSFCIATSSHIDLSLSERDLLSLHISKEILVSYPENEQPVSKMKC